MFLNRKDMRIEIGKILNNFPRVTECFFYNGQKIIDNKGNDRFYASDNVDKTLKEILDVLNKEEKK